MCQATTYGIATPAFGLVHDDRINGSFAYQKTAPVYTGAVRFL